MEHETLDENINSASLLMFFMLSVTELKAFAHVWLSSTKNINKKVLSTFPNKGSFEDSLKVMRDNLTKDTLVTLGFKQRDKPIILN